MHDPRSMEQQLAAVQKFLRQELLRAMKEISQQCAGEIWMKDLEFVLWNMMRDTRSRSLRIKEVSVDRLTTLRNLTEAVDGFWVLRESDFIFVSGELLESLCADYDRRSR